MTRLLGPDENTRLVYTSIGGTLRSAAGKTAIIYADSAASSFADILTEGGAAVAGSALTVDTYSKIPIFQFPNGVDVVYTRVDEGPITALYARMDDRLDSLDSRVEDLEAGGGVAAHEADTTNIHGIANTANLELTTNKGAANGYAALSGGHVPVAQLGSGTADDSTYLRGDGAWAAVVTANCAQTTPEEYGAARDGRTIFDAAITSGDNTLTSATAGFTPDIVGKVIVVDGAGAGAVDFTLSTTVASFNSSTSVELTAAASNTVSSARATYGTDDTAAIRAAIVAVVAAGQADGTNYGKVLFSAGQYMVAGALVKGGTTYGNAQIPLPVIAETATKFTLCLIGVPDSSAFAHWNQDDAQISGAVLRSTLVGTTLDGTWSAPSIIGGPTRADSGGGFPAGWSNMLLHVDGLTIIAPRDPGVTFIDGGRLAQCTGGTISLLADQSPTQMHDNAINNDLGLGIRMPRIGNNDNVQFKSISIEGVYYGIVLCDHLIIERAAIIYGRVALFASVGGTAEHGVTIGNLSVEQCDTILEAIVTPGGKFPVVINQVNTEILASTAFVDTNNGLVGLVNYTNNSGAAPTVSGCENIKIVDLNRNTGAVTAPAIPASTVELKNPFFRDAWVAVVGGTLTEIKVGGQTVATAPGPVVLPNARKISLTYTVAPTSWIWTLF